MGVGGGGGGGWGGGRETHPSEKSQSYVEFLSNTGPYPVGNYKATKPAVNVWPISAHWQNAI